MVPTPENDEILAALRGAESKRRRKATLFGAAASVFVIGAFALSILFSEALFQPKLDIEEGERNVLANTNDPQCRGFIAQITAIGQRYKTLEPELARELLGADRAEIERLLAALGSLSSRIEETRELADEAELRFDNSRGEVNDWYRYTLNELELLQRVGRERLESLPTVEPDAGTVVDQLDAPEEEEKPAKPTSNKTPQERLDGAMLATSEAFEQFRVWHTGALHPCGKASEGETPWTPDDAPVNAQE